MTHFFQTISMITSGATTCISSDDGDRIEAAERATLRRYPGTPEEAAETLAIAHAWAGCDDAPEMQAEARAAINSVIAFLGGVPAPVAGYYGLEAVDELAA